MALKIKLKRMGTKKKACYRIIVSESRSARDGNVIDLLGTYDPHVNPPKITMDTVKLEAWLKNGARPTEKVDSIVKKSLKAAQSA